VDSLSGKEQNSFPLLVNKMEGIQTEAAADFSIGKV